MKIKDFIKKKFIRVEKEKVIIPIMEGQYLNNRKALITGSSSGIGYAIAKSFLKNGAKIIICGRSYAKLEKAKNALVLECDCDESRIELLTFDISDIKVMRNNFYDFISQSSEKIDIFVNNAGINGGNIFPNTKEEDYNQILEINLKGTYFFSQEIVKYMIDNHIKGNILNVTSSSALRPAISPYIISKWGERSLTLGMAKKYLPYGIIVNGIAPGSTMTPMLKKEIENNLNLDYSPSKRYGTVEEIGNIATILVSTMGRMIVGDTIYVTGGAGIITFDDMEY